MSSFKSLVTILAVICIFAVGLGAGYALFHPNTAPRTVISSDLILTSLRDRGFLVSQTILLDIPVTIDKNTGNAFKDFFLGQKIEARATMEANLGIDLRDIQPSDIKIDANSITLTIPTTTLFNVRLVGPVEVKNAQGLVKRLVDNDDGYNLAISALTAQAQQAALKSEYQDRARQAAHEELKRMLFFAAPDKQITIKN